MFACSGLVCCCTGVLNVGSVMCGCFTGHQGRRQFRTELRRTVAVAVGGSANVVRQQSVTAHLYASGVPDAGRLTKPKLGPPC